MIHKADPVLVAAIQALPEAQQANLRYHALIGTPVCKALDWYVSPDGAGCLAAMALSRRLGDPIDGRAEVPPDLAEVYHDLAAGAGGWAEYHATENRVSEDVVYASIREATE